MKKIIVLSLGIFYLLPSSVTLAATVTCQVKEIVGSTLILENCDAKRLNDFKKGHKVKVKLQKKES